MLMNANHRRIEQQVLQLGLAAQRFEDGVPDSASAPAQKTLKDRVPFAEPFGQIAPGSAGPSNPQNRIHETTIVLGRSSGMVRLPWQKRLDSVPLFVRQL